MRTTLALGFLLLLGPAASWAQTDVSNASIECDTVLGTVSFKPPFTFGGTATPTLIGVKGTLGNCFASGGPAILSGKFSGKLTGTSNDCAFLNGTHPLTGPITVKWKSAAPIMPASSTVTVSTATGGAFFIGGVFGTATYIQLNLGISGVSGAYTGGDGGTSSSNPIVASQASQEVLGGECAAGGLKKLNIGIATLMLR